MPAFLYNVLDAAGSRLSGELESASSAAAAAELRGRGLTVIGLEEAQQPAHSRGWKPSELLWIRSLDIEICLYQLATLLRSGLTLLGALRLVAEQSERGRLRRVWEEVVTAIESGRTFADALAQHPCFNRLVVQLVSVGEQTGHLGPVLERAAMALEKKRTLRASLLTTLMYPAIVFLLAIGLAVYMVIGVLPKLQVFLRAMGKKLPPMTQRLLDISDWIQINGVTTVIIAVSSVLALVMLFLWPPGRAVIDALALRIPLLGKAFRTAGTALFATSFSALLSSGVTLIEALRVTERLMGNRRLADIVTTAREQVMQGEPLARHLSRPHGFMPMLPRMIAVGESSGTLDNVLDEVARFHEAQLDRLIKRLTALIEPAVIVTVGTVVGYVYISFFMALFAATGPGNNIR
ncbi:MAG: type II secretion system F family protein [Prosthecobacter sp.]|uniref:type II secretion system F family protein n=1 Tax=Prosthecobacter sp. TaxID=1965333 RepID=UPI003BB004ED